MKNDQWVRIETYVSNRLKNEKEFVIDLEEFRSMFGLPEPFYADLPEMKEQNAPDFHLLRRGAGCRMDSHFGGFEFTVCEP